MAERTPVSPERRPHRPSRGQVIRRRVVALAVVLAAIVAAVAAIAIALPHTKSKPPATTIVAPAPKPFRVIFPEGFTQAQMAQRVQAVAKIARRKSGKPVKIARRTYLAATRTLTVPCFTPRKRTRVEGFLFPATYDFLAKTTSRQLVQAQVKAFCTNWKHLGLAYAKSKNLTPYDVLVIASMVEKEAQVPSERPLIAAVIYNRLHLRMALGIDATLRYGLDIPPTKAILQSQLESDNPYNTRHRPGLPPTPIANPGLASLKAAAHPAHVDYLYFVRKPDKRHHFFTASASEFNQYQCQHGYGC
jgi:uncharacterized YceG family protein